MPPKRKRNAETDDIPHTSRSLRSATCSETSQPKLNTATRSNAKGNANKKIKTPEISQPLKSSKPSSAPKTKTVISMSWPLYSKASMEKLFAKYASEDDSSVIGIVGLEKLCTDAKISMEGAQPLLLAWLLEVSELERIGIGEWRTGMNALKIDTLEKLNFALSEYEALLISLTPASRPEMTNKKHAREPYNRRLNYWVYAEDISRAFSSFYSYVFRLAKASQSRSLSIEMAKPLWVTLLSEKYSIINDLIDFIEEQGTLRGVNKDIWEMTLDFCKTFSTSLNEFETDGEWPTLFDEFYVWKTARQHAAVESAN